MSVHVLVVDDDSSMRMLMQELLQSHVDNQKFTVHLAEDGLVALDMLMRHPEIDILVVDVRMPNMDGLTFLSILDAQRNKMNPLLTAIVMSAYDDRAKIRQAMNLGCFDFIIKPLDTTDFFSTLDRAVAHVSRLRQVYIERREAQRLLEAANQALEWRVQERTADLLAANKALREANEELDSFSHTVAHDLKSPLSLVLGYTDYLKAELQDRDLYDKSLAEICTKIEQAGQTSVRIIDEIMLLASVRKEDVRPIPLDMERVMKQAMYRMGGMISEYQAQINLPETWLPALGHDSWVEAVWINYLSNAMKYGGNPPVISLGCEQSSPEQVRYWLQDNGLGIPLELQPNLFQEFRRLNQIRIKGTGLGLSIVKHIVEKLGGSVGLESELGHGSRFYFTLPAILD